MKIQCGWRAPISGCVLILALAGCASIGAGPDAASSAVKVAPPAAWSASDPAIKASAPPAEELASWWRQLRDPSLDQLIAQAMNGAPDMRTAQARLRQSRAARDLASANLFPSLGASVSANRSKAGSGTGGSGAAQTTYAAGADVSWEPSIFGGLQAAARGAEADAAAAAASVGATRVSLVAEVALNYAALRTYQRRIAIAADNLASQAETLQLAEWRAQAGLATALDAEQARTTIEQTRASIPALENGRAEAEHHLAVLTGQPPGALRSMLSETKPLPAIPDQVAAGIPADTIRQRPDVRAAEFTLRAEIARSAQAEATRYPSLALSGSWGWQALSAAGLGSGANLVSSLAASLSGTLFDGGRIRSRIAAQYAIQEQTLAAYEKSVLTALEDVENALTAYAAGRRRLQADTRAADAARNAAALARILFEAGATDFQKVLDTDRTRLSAEDALAAAEGDALAAVVRLYKALGGGWRSNETHTETHS